MTRIPKVPPTIKEAPPQKLVLPPVINLRDFQYRIVDEQSTGEGNEIRLDIMHPMFPLIIVLPFDRLVFAQFVRDANSTMNRADERRDDNNGSAA